MADYQVVMVAGRAASRNPLILNDLPCQSFRLPNHPFPDTLLLHEFAFQFAVGQSVPADVKPKHDVIEDFWVRIWRCRGRAVFRLCPFVHIFTLAE